MKNNFYLLFLLLFPVTAFAQIIPLTNPSFEDVGRHSHVPRGWYDCGFPGETPPDTQPDTKGVFGINTRSYDGFTYLGMVVRDNNTWESVSQQLPIALEIDSCYTLSVAAVRSDTYFSLSRKTGLDANYYLPVILRIYGGFDYCDKEELLVSSNPIKNLGWKDFQFTFRPTENFTYLIIEAYYTASMREPYNGNVMIDFLQLEKGCKEK